MAHKPLEGRIEAITRDLKTPAGDAEAFSSPERIIANRGEFVLRCHETWKRLHLEAVQGLFFFEGWLRREKTNPMGPPAEEYGKYNKLVYRRINDAIIWSVFGLQRHVVKRFCLYKPRPALLESNPDSVYAALDAFNADPMSLAIWNDATSCLDIGDLTVIKDGLRPEPEFIELKDGEVNAEILEVLALVGEERSGRFEAFKAKRAKSGLDQYNRVLRQRKTGEQAIELLLNERGVDPATGLEARIVDIQVEQESYDIDLDRVLLKALTDHSEVIELVAGCIWVYANADPEINRHQAPLRFLDFLSKHISAAHYAGIRKPAAQDRDRIVPLNWGFHHPVSIPIFLRSLEASAIAATIWGGLQHKVMLYIDWGRFATLCTGCGVTFALAGGKAVRRARSMPANVRPALINGQLAQIEVENSRMEVTDPALVRILFDGTTPQTIVKNIIAHSEILKQDAGQTQ
jgi:hypothetical protein